MDRLNSDKVIKSWGELTEGLIREYGAVMVTGWYDAIAGGESRRKKSKPGLKDALLRFIRRRTRVSRTQALLFMQSRKVHAAELEGFLVELRNEGFICQEQIMTAGRPQMVYTISTGR